MRLSPAVGYVCFQKRMTSEDAETAREVRNMLKIYKTHSGLLSETEEFEEGVWVDLAAPSMEEIRLIAEQYQIDADDIVAILDDEETSRVEQQAGYLFILIDIRTERLYDDSSGCISDRESGNHSLRGTERYFSLFPAEKRHTEDKHKPLFQYEETDTFCLSASLCGCS